MKDLLTILGLCILFGIFAFVAVIYSKHPEAKLDPGHFVKTETLQDYDSSYDTFDPNYENTGIFSCGSVNFSVYVPVKNMHFSVSPVVPGYFQEFWWKSEMIPGSSNWVFIACKSFENYTQWQKDVQAENPQFDVLQSDLADLELSGYSVVENRSQREQSGVIYDYDVVLKRNANLPSSDKGATYMLIRSKNLPDKKKNRLTSVNLVFYSYTYDKDVVKNFDDIFNTLKFIP